MPEGHTIHRLARDHGRWFAGHVLGAQSPQGRFTEGAAQLDGSVLHRVDAWGKHLFYRFDAGTLHVHLGLFGRFRMRKRPAAAVRSPPRLVLSNVEREVRLSGPTACELLDATAESTLLGRLGPDPLRPDGAADAFVERVKGRRKAVGAVLLDQSLIAGIGNVYRSELLFRHGLHPETKASEVSPATWHALWDDAVGLLELGVRLNRIVTVEPRERDRASPRQLVRGERVYVYRRPACLRCGASVQRLQVAHRTAYACLRCQPQRPA